jgi:hypothetical protein
MIAIREKLTNLVRLCVSLCISLLSLWLIKHRESKELRKVHSVNACNTTLFI